jgi:hypothetical protein
MGKENPQSELTRLEKEQHKAKQDEVFEGFLAAECAEHNRNSERIHALEIEFTATHAAKNNRSLLRQSRDSTRTRFAKQTRPHRRSAALPHPRSEVSRRRIVTQ